LIHPYPGDDFIYLDPHTNQKSCTIGEKSTEQEKEADLTYHCDSPRLMPIKNIDPSLALVRIHVRLIETCS